MTGALKENEISYKIRKGIFEVYNFLGPGLLESIYEAALSHELVLSGLQVQRQVNCPVIYKGVNLDLGFRIDLIVENLVLIEIKSVTELNDIYHKQVLTYLKLTNKKLGLLVKFNSEDISKAIFRKVNGL